MTSKGETEFASGIRPYIVVFDEGAVHSEAVFSKAVLSKAVLGEATIAMATALSDDHEIGEPEILFQHTVKGGLYQLSGAEAKEVAADPRVRYVEVDREIRLQANQIDAPWGLDRIDQPALPLDRSYSFAGSAANVKAYIIDTGINIEHSEFENRAEYGVDTIDGDSDASDCHGHGTHVAGTVGGRVFGVAKDVKLVAVRVLDCRGSGSISSVIQGIEWVTKNHQAPAVANMSLGGAGSQAIDDAVRASIRSGVKYVVAAGNENTDACVASPARVPEAITVGATTSNDTRSSFSNFGRCVDIFAPGSDILSAWFDTKTSSRSISGTSMAAPHVAGIVARLLGQMPTLSSDEVSRRVLQAGRRGLIMNAGQGSPNLLLSSSFLSQDGGLDPGLDEPGVVRISINASLVGLNGSTGEEKLYVVHYPPNTKALEFRIDGTNGDADLYVRQGGKPDARAFDCRPFLNGSRETCKAENLAMNGGKIYLRLHAYRSYANVRLEVRDVSK